MSVLTRKEFQSELEIGFGWAAGSFGNKLSRHDDALRAIIRQAVEDVEKMPHGLGCRSSATMRCENSAAGPCAGSIIGCRTHTPERFICNCGHNAAIERMKKGLGEK